MKTTKKNRKQIVRSERAQACARAWLVAVIAALGLLVTVEAADIVRAARNGSTGTSGDATVNAANPATGNVAGVPVQARTNAEAQLAAARNALAAVRAMQVQARTATLANRTVPNGISLGGLVPDTGVPVFDGNGNASPSVTWTGVNNLNQTKDNSTITITQNQQTAVLNWATFNVGSGTTLKFDQSAGGTNEANWIAFNKVGVAGSPSQILGQIQAPGQVYVINPNGIIFGGTAQVNTRSLVASSLPINDNLVQSGLLNNPDLQFLFSGLALPTGSQTGSFTPVMSVPMMAGSVSYTAAAPTGIGHASDLGKITAITYLDPTHGPISLDSATDYSAPVLDGQNNVTVALTPAGQAKVGGQAVSFSYSPSASAYGMVTVQPGARIVAPTTADHVGGLIALVGPNVNNQGTLSAPDGQVILAAGLQVALTAHRQDDPSLRGLDVYVGQVSDTADSNYVTGKASAGSVTNGVVFDSQGNVVAKGLIETADDRFDGSVPLELPGSIVMAGQTVNQNGVIASATTVSSNGRIDLQANFNAGSNANYNSSDVTSVPFLYPSATGATGSVTLGAGSFMQVIPSDSLTDRVARSLDQGLALRSQINIKGKNIYLGAAGSAGATLYAPNAAVTIQAGSWTNNGSENVFYASGGQVFMAAGSGINVAGSAGEQAGATAPVTENIVSVQLLGSELANSPLQQTGVLRGQTVQVDLRVHGPWDQTLNGGLGGYAWVGTPLANASGWIGLVQRTAGELTTAGGTVNIQSGGPVVMLPGSAINVSGGWIDYTPGRIQTTKLILDGHIYDISQATPDLVYSGIYDGSVTQTDVKWGVTRTSVNQTLLGYSDPGYTQGGDGGKIALTAPWVALDGGNGAFVGQTSSGSRQILTAPAAGAYDLVAKPSEFSLVFGAQFLDTSNSNNIVSYSPTPPNVLLQSGGRQVALVFDPAAGYADSSSAQGAVAGDRQNKVYLSPDLVNRNGFGFFTIDNGDDNLGASGRADSTVYGNLTVSSALDFMPASALGAYLNTSVSDYVLHPIASLNLIGANVTISSNITASGGSLNFTALNVSPSQRGAAGYTVNGISYPTITTSVQGRGSVTLQSPAKLNAAGVVLDYRLPAQSLTDAVAIKGGTVSLQGYITNLEEGSAITVSGGATVSATGKVTWGNGGTVSLLALNEQQFDGAKLELPESYTGNAGSFALSGFSGGAGGTLNITGPLVQIGGPAANSDTLWLSPNLFGTDTSVAGGFATFNLTGLADSRQPNQAALEIAGTTPIAPVVWSYRANQQKTGPAMFQTFVPDEIYQTPVKLTFTAKGNSSISSVGAQGLTGGLVLENNTDSKNSLASLPMILLPANAAGSVALKGDSVAVFGEVVVPGGNISITGAGNSAAIFGGDTTTPLVTVYLGPSSKLSTDGVPLLATGTNSQGYRVGSVLAGGTITVDGNLAADAGATLSANGATGTIYVSPYQTSLAAARATADSGFPFAPTSVASNGGNITLTGEQELFSDAVLTAKAGGRTALGGVFTVQSGLFDPNNTLDNLLPSLPTLLLLSNGRTLPTKGKSGIGQAVIDASGQIVSNLNAGSGSQHYFGGAISTDSFGGGGFDWLNFNGNVEFSGNVSLKAGSGITVASDGRNQARTLAGGAIQADAAQPSSLKISAPYVALGRPFASLLPGSQNGLPSTSQFKPTTGAASFAVDGAELIDVGNLSFANIGTAGLTTTSGGEVRGDGIFEMAGKLTITAGQVYPPTASTFTIAVYDTAPNAADGQVTFVRKGTPSQVPLSAGGQLNVYASAIDQGGVLRAPLGKINLGNTDLGNTDPMSGTAFPTTTTIKLDPNSVTSVSTSTFDPITGRLTGQPLALPIPYGVNLNGTSWIDPTGADITVADSADRTTKQITIAASTINDQVGSLIDISGGSDLYAYRFVTGVHGTNDILSAYSSSYAIIPGYTAGYSPFGAYAVSSNSDNLGGDPGYVSLKTQATPNLQAGDSIRIDLGNGAGLKTYTLLPARYALLPGAYLVTPKSSAPTGTVQQPDGSSLTPGYRYNALDINRTVTPLYTNWAVAAGSVVRTRAEYDDSLANTFFATSAAANNVAVRQLPEDAGQLVLAAQTAMVLAGKVGANPLVGSAGTALGRGGFVDITSPQDIVITGSNTNQSQYIASSTLFLSSDELNNFGAESLLIGGLRTRAGTGTTVTVTSDQVTVDNAGSALKGPDVILAANKNLTVVAGSAVEGVGKVSGPADALNVIGETTIFKNGATGFSIARGGVAVGFPQGIVTDTVTADVAGFVTTADGKTQTPFAAGAPIAVSAGETVTLSAAGNLNLSQGKDPIPVVCGDGAVLRVSGSAAAQLARSGVISSATLTPALIVGAATVSGAAVALDSTGTTALDPKAALSGTLVALSSGRISLALANSGGLPTDAGLVLTTDALQAFQAGTQSLSLLSYSSLDVYGNGAVGENPAGQPLFQDLALHAAEIRGFSSDATSGNVARGGTVMFAALQNILLDNSATGTVPGAAPTFGGSIQFDAGSTGTITLGVNPTAIDQFAEVTLVAGGGIRVVGAGGISAQNDMTLATPLVTAASGAVQTLQAKGSLVLKRTGTGSAMVAADGLGAHLTLTGSSVAVNSDVTLHSGGLTLHATGTDSTGSVRVGDSATSVLDVSGTKKTFFDVASYTDGGKISLASDNGSVKLGTTTLNVAAALPGAGAGSAGTLTISAPKGGFTSTGTLLGQGGIGGQGGTFSLDVGRIAGGDVTLLGSLVSTGGFTESIALRDRTDSLVQIDGAIKASAINLSADGGDIDVTGTLDASGKAIGQTGGAIKVSATGSVIVESGAQLTAEGYCYDNAGKGGAIALSAGNYTYNDSTKTGSVAATARITLAQGSTVNLAVNNNFTTEDLALNPGLATTVAASQNLPGGTLHLRAPQTADSTGVQIDSLSAVFLGAPTVVVEGFRVYDLSEAASFTSSSGAITNIPTSGLITSAVEQAIRANGTLFATANEQANRGSLLAGSKLDPTLLHLQPGAEIVNNGTAVDTITTLYTSGSTTGSTFVINNVPKGTSSSPGTVSISLPGGIAVGDAIKLSGTSSSFWVNFSDGSSPVSVSSGGIFVADSRPVSSITFKNITSSVKTGTLLFSAGSVPIALANPVSSNGAVVTPTTTKATSFTTNPGDLTIPSTWDLSSFRFGAPGENEPGILTLRAKNNLVFAFDASLSDGFDPANVTAAGTSYPLWNAPLQSSRSWSYQLIAGSDYSGANNQQVLPLSTLAGGGSVLFGQGAVGLPAAPTTVTRAAIIPQYYQVIRTGTGDINLAAGGDVKLLNSLATIYTAGQLVPNPTSVLNTNDFDLPNAYYNSTGTSALGSAQLNTTGAAYPAQYSMGGGNLTILAQGNIEHVKLDGSADSAKEMPTNWLYRRGDVDATGAFATVQTKDSAGKIINSVASTTWWVDYSNFFEGVGALGGGNLTVSAGHDVTNVDAVVPTNARVAGKDASGNPLAPVLANLVELGGGNLTVRAGNNIDGGVYYVERGTGTLDAGDKILTNATRAATILASPTTDQATWLPTTLFLGQGNFNISAVNDVTLGSVANVFLLPQGINNSYFQQTYFSTYATSDSVGVSALLGDVTIKNGTDGSLFNWYANVLAYASGSKNTRSSTAEPWLRLITPGGSTFPSFGPFWPAALNATAFVGDINLVSGFTLSPSPTGTLDLLAGKSINGLNVIRSGALAWGTSQVTVSDANPDAIAGVDSPQGYLTAVNASPAISNDPLPLVTALSSDTGNTNLDVRTLQELHGTDPKNPQLPLHAEDSSVAHLYADTGDISGLMLLSPKATRVSAGRNITDIALYLQNARSTDVSVVSAGRDLIAYDPSSLLRQTAKADGALLDISTAEPGDIQLGGPGSLDVLAGRNIDLGVPLPSNLGANSAGVGVGLASIGNTRNPHLPFAGASLVVASSLAGLTGSDFSTANLDAFIARFLNPDTANTLATEYLPELGKLLGLADGASDTAIWTAYNNRFPADAQVSTLLPQRYQLALDIFYQILRDSGRDHTSGTNQSDLNYEVGYEVIRTLFPGASSTGDGSWPTTGGISLSGRSIETTNGGDISLLAPGGGLTLGTTQPTGTTATPGIVTQEGGNISSFTRDKVDLGVFRIFTLRGGNEILWSSRGDIAAGVSSKTVQAAPPTRVLIDVTSASVKTDLAGLATGGGIGVLATVAGVTPGNVDLIAPQGTVDAGDAGIRASGNLNIAAQHVVNAANIQVAGTSTGTPPPPASPNIAPLAAASNTTAAVASAGNETTRHEASAAPPPELPSIITVEILGYGGGDGDDPDARS